MSALLKTMDLVRKYSLLTIVVLAICSVSVKSEREPGDIDQESLNLLLSPRIFEALSDLLKPPDQAVAVAGDISTDSELVSRRNKRFAPTRVDSKVTKLKTPRPEDDADVPVIRGLGGLSPIELRQLHLQEDQDDGKLIRTTTERARTRNEKSALNKKKDDSDVPVISGTKDPNNPSREEAREGKSDEDNTVVLLNGADAAPPPPPPPPQPRPLGGKARCEQRKLLLQLDEQLAVMRKLNEQRDADIARTMSWVASAGAGGPGADYLQRTPQKVPNVPIPYIPYVSNLPIYGRSDWVSLPLQPSYEYQISGDSGPAIAGIYRRTWGTPSVPADAIDCDYEDDRNQANQGAILISTPPPNNFQRPGFDSRSLHNPGGYPSTPAPNSFQRPGFDSRPLHNPNGFTSTPAPNSFQRPGFDSRPLHNPNGFTSTPAPNSFQRPGFDSRPLHNPGGYTSPNTFRAPGFDDRNLRHPGVYGVVQTPGTLQRDSYGRAYVPIAPKIEVDDKLAKPKDDPAEDEEQE